MRANIQRTNGSPFYMPADLIFIVCAALFAWLTYQGSLAISSQGTFLDSDLMTYAQGMAGSANPELFMTDPVLQRASPSNSIPNLERCIAQYLAPEHNWAVGLFRAGALAIFVFYCSWYTLGRWIFHKPVLAALLSICCGITVWVGWGTFWGITHSDPVPRVFYGALLPLLLGLTAIGLKWPLIRPVVMGLAGICMWVHGVSALNGGAMIFMTFLLNPSGPFLRQLSSLFLCLLAFFIPVWLFLGTSLINPPAFSSQELDIFRDMAALRWAQDYSDFWPRFYRFFSPASHAFPILLGGLAGFLLTLYIGTSREKLFCRMYPCFILALLIVALFCWAESTYAGQMGRVAMGHELIRGMRFLIPISWLLIICGIGNLAGKWLQRLIFCAVLGGICLLCHDRQFMAAEYAISQYTDIRLPLTATAELEKSKADNFAKVLEQVQKLVPEGEAIYCPEDVMQVRYKILRPLIHTFKDGYAHYYNRDVQKARDWLELEELRRGGEQGWKLAWLTSGAPWLLIPAHMLEMPFSDGQIVLDMDGWILAKRKRDSAENPSFKLFTHQSNA